MHRVHHAVRLRIPRIAVARMVLNILLDTALGAIPFVGDAFDFVFKANTKNVAILRDSLGGRRRSGGDWLFVAAVMLALAAVITLPLVALALLLRRLF